ncbi:SDR family NAD(P)-dependent oxidoreductase [Cryptosporangium arvum]|uniref:SDR family NAD(P)-dependent oxidoreductase n=1 Tax=Cryptosporangium arvum TaxID=80871 RepID=UPI0004AD437A|nr:3-oxoacyl-ACP reductase family protein [Cryptosporangium arvum]
MNELTNKVALVTGGSRGIGAAIARRLSECGADVALTYVQGYDQAHAVACEIKDTGRRAIAIKADGRNVDEVTGAVDRTAEMFGRLDIVVNNAGVFTVGPVDDLGDEEFAHTMAVNVQAPYAASRAALRHLKPGGRIVTIGSNVAERTTFSGFTLYAMSKTALIGMTKGLARELGPREITVNLVNPGPTDTDANPADGPNAEGIRSFTALDRYAKADEIASVVSFLASDDARYVTGASISVDGGFTV